jgi:HPt (histidine-containing phosphotransfer) domain-containing protein
MSEAAIDRNTFAELSETMGDDFIKELVTAYLEDTPQQIETLKQALTAGDADAFRRAAHTIKSTSLNFGASGLAGQARQLEELGRAGLLDGAAPQVDSLGAVFTIVQQELQELGYA